MLPKQGYLSTILPFFGAFLMIIFFSYFYIRRYRNKYENDSLSFWTSVVSLSIVLVTSALIPIDIFLVSYMKDGTSFKQWAETLESRQSIENVVLYCFYALYGLVFFCIFVLIPFMYFFYEEKDDDSFFPNNHLCDTIKFTSIFVFVAVVFLIIGATIPLKAISDSKDAKGIIDFLMHENNKGESALLMVLSILSVIGMLNLAFYTGFGIFSWPIGLIRGTKSSKIHSEEIQSRNITLQTRINALKDKAIRNRLTNKERVLLSKLEEEERNTIIENNLVHEHRSSWNYKLRVVIRPFEIFTGILAGILGIILWISLLLSNIDKAMHSLGIKNGYALVKPTIPNPIDYVLVFLQKVFPLDYILIILIIWLLVLCTFSGIRNLGLKIFLIKTYKLRYKRTSPQGLLLTCATLMLTVLAFNIFIYYVSPKYATYGNQHYSSYSIDNQTSNHNLNYTSEYCPNPKEPKDCTMTRNSYILINFFFKAWYFGAIYYWLIWFFLSTSLLSLVYSLCRKSRTVTDYLVERDEFEESEEDTIIH